MSEPLSAQTMVDHWFTQVVGQSVWEPSVGVGSFLTIEFGNRRKTSTGRSQGEFHLWVYGALWEIRDRTRIVATSSDEHEVMQAGAQLLDGASLRDVRFDRERMTLSLLFDRAVELSIAPLGDPEMEEWLLYLDDGTVITAGPGQAVVRESASG